MGRIPRIASALAALVAAWAFWWWGTGLCFSALARLVGRLGSAGWRSALLDVLADTTRILTDATLAPLLFAVTLLVPLAILFRAVARARLRSGFGDPLGAVRAWADRHARAFRGLVALPAGAWLAVWTAHVAFYVRGWGGTSMYGALADSDWVQRMHSIYAAGMAAGWCIGAVSAVGVYAATRAATRALLAPTLRPEDEETADGAADGGIHFDAVAITLETRAAIAAMAMLPFLCVGAINAAGLNDAATVTALVAYAALAGLGAVAFRRASRVAVGVDGVLVRGTSRERFLAYRDLDGVRAVGATIELLRRGAPILRLQLHGRDAAKKDAIVERIRGAILESAGAASAASHAAVALPDAELTRLAEGAVDYRAAAITREQLWSVVEGPAHDARARASAARALAASGDREERRRLGVAADHSAQPIVRVELRELAFVDEEDADAANAAEERFRRRDHR